MTKKSVAIIDYGAGNLQSVSNAFSALGTKAEVISNPAGLDEYMHLILPGVGNFNQCAEKLMRGGWHETLLRLLDQKKYVLGICVGMQLMFSGSEETSDVSSNKYPGLKIIDDEIKHLRTPHNERLPHVGWNSIMFDKSKSSKLFDGIENGTDMYFTHSYGYYSTNKKYELAYVHYGTNFSAVVQKSTFFGVQFHPEKSGKPGSRLLKNFLALC